MIVELRVNTERILVNNNKMKEDHFLKSFPSPGPSMPDSDSGSTHIFGCAQPWRYRSEEVSILHRNWWRTKDRHLRCFALSHTKMFGEIGFSRIESGIIGNYLWLSFSRTLFVIHLHVQQHRLIVINTLSNSSFQIITSPIIYQSNNQRCSINHEVK